MKLKIKKLELTWKLDRENNKFKICYFICIFNNNMQNKLNEFMVLSTISIKKLIL